MGSEMCIRDRDCRALKSPIRISAHSIGLPGSIDFAPFKVKGEKRYMVFFKAPDADAMTAAFKEYTAKQVRKAERPSVLEKLQHFKSLIQAAVVDRTKRKELER